MLSHQLLTQAIQKTISTSREQCISFAQFMEMALFFPSVGYYSAHANLLGQSGDFTTAPEISATFGRCLARYCLPILQSCAQSGVIMEIGPGTGQLAVDILRSLEQMKSLPKRYILVETSPVLKKKQMDNLKRWIPHLVDRIEYRDRLPNKTIEGVILANEVLDTLPVHRFEIRNGKRYEHYVGYQKNQWTIQRRVPSRALNHHIEQIQTTYLGDIQHYTSEICLALNHWFASLQACLSKGCLLLIDYGKSAKEYYHPERIEGTLRCYYQQSCYVDPLQRVGQQDITADVNFTQVATQAVTHHLNVVAYVSQAAFLLMTGLLESQKSCYDESLYLKIKGQMHQLMAPSEMGESCKVMVLERGLSCELLPLTEYDRRVSL